MALANHRSGHLAYRIYSSTIRFHLCRYNQPRQRLWTFLIFLISSESSSAMLFVRNRWCCRRYRDNYRREAEIVLERTTSLHLLHRVVLALPWTVLPLAGDIDISSSLHFHRLERDEDISVPILLSARPDDCNCERNMYHRLRIERSSIAVITCTIEYIRSKLDNRFPIPQRTRSNYDHHACTRWRSSSRWRKLSR